MTETSSRIGARLSAVLAAIVAVLLTVGTLAPAVAAQESAEASAPPTETASPEASSESPAPTPAVWTSKDDYVPAEVVDINASGWQAGEQVEVFVNDDEGQSWSHRGTATADEFGAFVHDVQLPGWFVATYNVTATGSSGRVAKTSFADSVAVGGSSANSNGSSGLASQQITISAPAVSAGDVLVAQIAIADAINSTFICPPSVAWTTIVNNTRDDKIRQQTFWFRASAAAGATSYTWQFRTSSCSGSSITGGTKGASGGVIRMTGVIASGSPVDAAAGDSSSSSGPFNAPAVTTTVANTHVLRFFAVFKNTTITHTTKPRIYHEASATVKERTIAAFDDGDKAVAGSTGTFTATLGSTAEMASQTVAIKEQPAPTKQDQTITFAQPTTPQSFGATFGINPTASSGLAVSVSASGGCTVSPATAPATVTMTSSTTACVLTASQAGNDSYNAAPSVQRTVAAQKASQTITFAHPTSPQTFGTTFNVNPTATSGLPVSISAVEGSGCSVAPATPGFNVTMTSGTSACVLVASQAGDGNYNAAADVQRTVDAQKADQAALAVTSPTSGTYGDVLTPAASGGSGTGALSFTASGSACEMGTGENAGKLLITSGSDSCSVTAHKAGDADYNAVSSVPQPVAINTREVAGSFTAADKDYDGSVVAQITSTTLNGAIPGDDVQLVGLATFGSANVGTDKTVTLNDAGLAGDDATKYTLVSVATTTADITPRPVTVTADPQSKTYGDGDPDLTYQVTAGSVVAGEGFTGALTRAAGENVGSYAIQQGTLSLGSNYALTFVGANLTVGPRAIEVTADPHAKTYGADDPALTHQVTSGSLVEGDSLTGALTREAGENVGTYAIEQGTLAASSNYTLTFVGNTFTISARALEVTADAQSKTYGAADPALTYEITGGSLVDGDELSGALVREAGEDVGTYSIGQGTLTAGDNYSLTVVPALLTIAPRAITVTADGKSKVYGENDPALTHQITSGSLVEGDALTGALTREAGESVGEFAIEQGTLAASSNYTLTFVGSTLTITPRPIEVTADPQSKIYGDDDPALTYTVTNGGLVGADGFTGELSRAAGENVGTYAIGQGTLSAGSNYELTFVGGDLTITTRPVEVTADAQSKNYGDDDPALTYDVTSGSVVDGDTFDGALTREAGENVGSYEIQQGTLSLGSNYALTFVSADLTISPRAITVTADEKSKTYGEDDPSLTYEVTSGSLVDGDTLSGALSRDAGEDVGSYAIGQGTLTAGDNYTLTFVSRDLTINARPIEVTADPKSKTYGEDDPALTYEVTGGSLVDGDAFSGALTRAAGEDVGTYVIGQGTLTAGDNYNLTVVGNDLTITPRAIEVTADPQSKTYGEDDPALTHKVTGGSLVEGDELTGALAREAGENVGTYAIGQGTLTAGDNYDLTFVGGNLTVNAKTVSGTFSVADKVYDGTDTATINSRGLQGVVEGDDVELTGGTATFAGSDAGTHAVTGSGFSLTGGDAGNYNLGAVTAPDATITPKPVAGSFTVADKTWDGTTTATITSRTLTGAINGDDVSLVGGSVSFPSPNVGTYTLTGTGFSLGGADAANYSLVSSTLQTTASILSAYRIQGFYKPVDMTPAGAPRVYNTVKGGSTVPLKFEVFTLSGQEVTSVSESGLSIQVSKVSCVTGVWQADDIPTATGDTSLRYDTTDGQFVFNWKVAKGAGTCYKITVRTGDGTTVMSGIGGTPASQEAFFVTK